MRSAEADRGSTCTLADNIARLVVGAFRDSQPAIDGHISEQTVVAGFVLVDDDEAQPLELLSWGMGTKFASDTAVASCLDGRIVRDCHAEILARRALLRVFYDELIAAADKGISAHNNGLTRLRLFQPSSEPGVGRSARKYRLRPGLRLVLYTSSMPCGNASLKRWAKGRTERFRSDLGARGIPSEEHARLHVTARDEGQIAVLVKGEIRSVASLKKDAGEATTSEVPAPVRHAGREGTLAPGTSRPQDLPVGAAGTMTCSDKIARWSHLGVQGALLSRWLNPVYLSGVVIGRKYSYEHARRALCCRLSHSAQAKRWRAPRGDKCSKLAQGVGLPAYQLQHPALMGTAVKLDESAIATSGARNGGARFSGRDGRASPCLAWALGDTQPEAIDGPSGRAVHTQEGKGVGAIAGDELTGTASVSRRAIFAKHLKLAQMSQPQDGYLEMRRTTYGAAKRKASEDYEQARSELLEGAFSDWITSNPELDQWCLNDSEAALSTVV